MARENLEDVVISLKPEEVIRAQRIVLDQDRDEAIKFLTECIGGKINDIMSRPH
jgi:hypothetical protein